MIKLTLKMVRKPYVGNNTDKLKGLLCLSIFFLGKLAVELHDHRFGASRRDKSGVSTETRLMYISHSPLSLWREYIKIAEHAGKELSERVVCEIESRYLVI
jgi:hypothetical protein